MQNRAIVFSNNQLDNSKVEEMLIKFGRFDFSVIRCNQFDECLSFVKSTKTECDVSLVFCKNQFIDKFLNKIRSDGDEMSLIFDQAVKLIANSSKLNMVEVSTSDSISDSENSRRMLFLPLELDMATFLNEFLEKRAVHCVSIFGKTASFVEKRFDEFQSVDTEFRYKMITKSQFLHIVYYSQYLDHERLLNIFGDSLFAFSDESLQDMVVELLKKQKLSLAVAEQISAGALTSKIAVADKEFLKRKDGESRETENENERENEKKDEDFVLKKSFILTNFDELDIQNAEIEKFGEVSKEIAYELTKNLLKKSESELAISVIGNASGKCFVAVGNKEEIHVFSTAFEGERQQVLDCICEFALFRLQKFVMEKCINNSN